MHRNIRTSQEMYTKCLDNTLYEVYSSKDSAKDLRDLLKKKYKAEDAGTKKFIVGKFLD